ncbi:hypothetical protein O5282_00055 [Escherichia coli]|nr:hypothetical protein [Escherichia coli]
MVGTYALNNGLFDVGIMLIAGVVGYFMQVRRISRHHP